MICLQCGTPNDDAAKTCSSCGTVLPQAPQASPPLSSPVAKKVLPDSTRNALNIIGMIAAGLLVLGFFLPWINTGRLRGFSRGLIPDINGIYFLKQIFGSDMSGDAIVPVILFLVLLISIPVFSVVYIIQKIKPNTTSVKLQTLAVALAGFLPLLFASIIIFMGSGNGLLMLFGRINLGVGAILMIIGAILLFGEVIYLVAQKNDSNTLGKAWVIAAIAGIISAALHYGMIEIAKTSDDGEGMLNIYTLFTLAVLAIGFNVGVNIHKSQDPGGKLGFTRCIAFSLMYGIVTGLGCYLVLLIQVPRSEEIPFGAAMILITFNTLFAFIFGAIRALSSPGIRTAETTPDTLSSDFLDNK